MVISFSQIIVWLIIGGLGGTLAGALVRWQREGFGVWTNLGIGLVGAVVAGSCSVCSESCRASRPSLFRCATWSRHSPDRFCFCSGCGCGRSAVEARRNQIAPSRLTLNREPKGSRP